jgi:hypothetical protein
MKNLFNNQDVAEKIYRIRENLSTALRSIRRGLRIFFQKLSAGITCLLAAIKYVSAKLKLATGKLLAVILQFLQNTKIEITKGMRWLKKGTLECAKKVVIALANLSSKFTRGIVSFFRTMANGIQKAVNNTALLLIKFGSGMASLFRTMANGMRRAANRIGSFLKGFASGALAILKKDSAKTSEHFRGAVRLVGSAANNTALLLIKFGSGMISLFRTMANGMRRAAKKIFSVCGRVFQFARYSWEKLIAMPNRMLNACKLLFFRCVRGVKNSTVRFFKALAGQYSLLKKFTASGKEALAK